MATMLLDSPTAGVDEDSRGSVPHMPPRWVRWGALSLIVLVALMIRYQFVDFETMDYRAFLSRWYQQIADAGGFSAFKEKFADYNYPYLYLLAILTYLHIPALLGVKLISVIFEVVLAVFAYRIVALKTERFWLRALAFGLMLLLPSVVANGSIWGQADAVYSACAVGGVYFLMRAHARDEWRRNPFWACVFFGLALAFKLQAIFVLPVLAFLLLRRKLPWYSLLAIPAVYLLLDVPALVVGAPWRTVLSVYLDQTDSYKQLTLGAANLYQLIPISGDATWLAHAGIACAAAMIVAFLGWSVWSKPPVTAMTILLVSTASAVIVPFLLPAMHDRYFYIAEILTVLLAFFLPVRYMIVPILVQASAIGVYHSSLSGDQGHAMGGFGGGQGHRGGQTPGGHPGSGGGHGPGSRPGGGLGGPGGGSGGYTSGRGDTALTVYGSMMALAVISVIYAVVDTFRSLTKSESH
ncbi:glycosyltransferase family 39 protein [Gordonia sp. CPCC 205333]|uniref:glycosyltransferase family 39 protein n=1 Tax=Gordonia sp. CPCC 205333 TaxID=3140790 RepID=UPI003AF35CF1